jgi:hypothetical protein
MHDRKIKIKKLAKTTTKRNRNKYFGRCNRLVRTINLNLEEGSTALMAFK